MRQRWHRLIAFGAVATATAVWLSTVGTSVASASTRLRSGSVHAQLVSRVIPAGSTTHALSPIGANVMAAIVGTLALAAFGFVVVTLVRRRHHVALSA